MTVSSETYRAEYTGNGTAVNFATGFYFLENSHIQAVLSVISTGVETVLAETTHYTLVGAGVGAGGTLTMLVAPTALQRLTIIRNVPLTQETDYVELTSFPADSHEAALDKGVMLIQQLQEGIDRCLQIPVSQTASGELPVPVAGMAIVWKADLSGLRNSVVALDTIDTYLTGALAAQTAAEHAQTDAEVAQAAAEAAQAAAESAVESDAGAVTIAADGSLTLLRTAKWNKIETYTSAATDDLESITGLQIGDRVELTPTSDGHTVVVKNNSRIILQNGADFIMNNAYDNIVLRCVAITPCVMREVSRANCGA